MCTPRSLNVAGLNFGTEVGSTRAGGGTRLRGVHGFVLIDAPPARLPTDCLSKLSDGVAEGALAFMDVDDVASSRWPSESRLQFLQ